MDNSPLRHEPLTRGLKSPPPLFHGCCTRGFGGSREQSRKAVQDISRRQGNAAQRSRLVTGLVWRTSPPDTRRGSGRCHMAGTGSSCRRGSRAHLVSHHDPSEPVSLADHAFGLQATSPERTAHHSVQIDQHPLELGPRLTRHPYLAIRPQDMDHATAPPHHQPNLPIPFA